MLDVGVTVSVPPSRPARTRSVSTRAVLACVLPHRIARWPIIGQSVSMVSGPSTVAKIPTRT